MPDTFCLTKLSRIIIHLRNLTKSLSGNLYNSNFNSVIPHRLLFFGRQCSHFASLQLMVNGQTKAREDPMNTLEIDNSVI